MSKKRYFALGLALGMTITAGVQVYAANGLNTVTSYLRNNFSIMYEDKVQDKGNYDLLVYKDRSYMPVRYLSEMLGCEVKWDDQTKNIIIKKPKVNPEKPNQPNNNTQIIDTTGFETLPQTVETDKYRLTATYLGGEYKKENPENRNLYLRLTNKTTDKNMRLDQGATVFEINGKKVEYKSIDSTLYDTRWYTKIAYYKDNPDGGDNIEGYIVLPVDIKPGDMIKITTYITIDGQKEKIPVVFKLDMNKIK